MCVQYEATTQMYMKDQLQIPYFVTAPPPLQRFNDCESTCKLYLTLVPIV